MKNNHFYALPYTLILFISQMFLYLGLLPEY